uniref:Uncharacterized protein n=1 Tax=Clytia hemisphaerica TaxID=252671 RepID=A0A7M5VB22_9CNID
MATLLRCLFALCVLVSLSYGRPSNNAPLSCTQQCFDRMDLCGPMDLTSLETYFDKCFKDSKKCRDQCRKAGQQPSLKAAKTFDKFEKIQQAYNSFRLRVLKIRMSSYSN